MRKMKRLLALGLAGMMVLSATGCKSSDKTKGSAADTTQAAATEGTSAGGTTAAAASSDGEDVTLKFTWWGGQTRHELTQQLLDKYTELHPNVTFEAVPSGWDGYFDKLATQRPQEPCRISFRWTISISVPMQRTIPSQI